MTPVGKKKEKTMLNEYLQETIERAQTNEKGVRNLRWPGKYAITAARRGTNSFRDFAPENLKNDESVQGIVVVEWTSMAGHDDDSMSRTGTLLDPQEDAVIQQHVADWDKPEEVLGPMRKVGLAK